MSAIGRPRRTAVRLATGVALLLLGAAVGGRGQIGFVSVTVQPRNSTSEDVVTINL